VTNKRTHSISIYRFRDKVAINPPKGDTFYLTPNEAFDMLIHLARGCDDIHKRAFVDSKMGTGYIEIIRDPSVYVEGEVK